MIRKLGSSIVAIALFLLVLGSGRVSYAQTKEGTLRMAGGTFNVICGDGRQATGEGTGILVGDGDRLLTNLHWIRNAPSALCVVLGTGLKTQGRVQDTMPDKDLALLQLEQSTGRPGAVFSTKISEGQPVIAIGYPNQGSRNAYDDFDGAVSRGTIKGAGTNSSGLHLLETTIAFNGRNTGGALFTLCGEVVGVNDELTRNLAINIQEAYPLLQRNNVRVQEASEPCGGGAAAETGGGPDPGEGSGQQPSGPSGGEDPGDDHGAPHEHSNYALWIVIGIAVLAIVGASTNKRGREVVQQAYHTVSHRYTSSYKASPVRQPGTSLISIAGPLAGRRFPLSRSITFVGRDPSLCQVVFPPDSSKVSRQHCSLRLDDDGNALLEDCGSVNGTFLQSGERIEARHPRRIRSGERFYLGSGSVGFEVKAEG